MSTLRVTDLVGLTEEGIHLINCHPINRIFGSVYTGRWQKAHRYVTDRHSAWHNGVVWLCAVDHISGEEFDPSKWKETPDYGLVFEHLEDFNNPHQVTKAQVGLGNVQNYPIATQAEAISGTRNDRYMTPDRTNEFYLSKAASEQDVIDGRRSDVFVSPQTVKPIYDYVEELMEKMSTSAVSEEVTINSNQFRQWDLRSLLGVDKFNDSDINGCEINIKVKDVDPISKSFGQYINSESVATGEIRDGRYVRVHNYFNTSLMFYIRVTVYPKGS